MNKPKLYIIIRSDLWDNNPGKMMAQAAHAQALFDLYDTTLFPDQYFDWCHDGKDNIGFGPTVVLSATWEQMCDIQERIIHRGMVEDPSYPWRNWYGDAFETSETTAMWAFVWEDSEFEYMSQYPLHP